MSLLELKDSKPILKKHVNTIHCSNNLTLVQRKLFNALLFNAYYDLPEQSKYQIPVKTLCGLIGYDSRDYKKLRKSIIDLITTAIEWNVIDQVNGEQKDKWRASSIIAAAKIENGVCSYEFSSVMRELLYTPEIYGRIDIKLMIKFKSNYGLALYENCIRFQGIAQTQWLSVKVFRKLMGIPDGYYQNFCDFKKRVLDVAVKEVNLHSPITITPEIRRVNKKVTSIRFKLSNKKNTIDEVDRQSEYMNATLANTLKNDFGLSTEALVDISLKYEMDFIQKKVDLIKQSESFKTGRIRGLAAYLIDALKRDYQPNKSSDAILAKHRLAFEDRLIREKKDQNDKLRTDNERIRTKVEAYVGQMKDTERDHLMEQFAHYLVKKDSFYLFKKYKEMGLISPAVRAMFNSFVQEVIEQKD